MGRLITVVLSVAVLYSVDCLEKRGIVETNYGQTPYYNQNPYYTQNPSVVHDATKQTPVVVSLQSPAGYQVNEQFPPQYSAQATAQMPYTAQQNAYIQGVLPYSQPNQYSVNQPFQAVGQHQATPLQQFSNLYLPFNQYQHISTDLNSDFSKIKAVPQAANNAPQIQPQPVGEIVGTIETKPLFSHQVYHPLHTNIQHSNNAPQVQYNNRAQHILQRQQVPVQRGNHAQHVQRNGNRANIHQPNLQKQRLSPLTPPRIYKNFHPIIPSVPSKPVPLNVTPRPVPIKNQQNEEQNEEQEEEKEEVNEEEEENEKQEEEDEDHENQEEEQSAEEEDRPGNFFGKFSDDDHEKYEEDEDHEEHKRPSKLSSFEVPKALDKHNYYKNKHFSNPIKSDPDLRNYREFKEPKIEFKMFKFMKSSIPDKEFFEGKGSENVPVVQRNKESYKSQWVISSKMSSMTDE